MITINCVHFLFNCNNYVTMHGVKNVILFAPSVKISSVSAWKVPKNVNFQILRHSYIPFISVGYSGTIRDIDCSVTVRCCWSEVNELPITSPSTHFTFNKLHLQNILPSTRFTSKTLHIQHTSPSTHFTFNTLLQYTSPPTHFTFNTLHLQHTSPSTNITFKTFYLQRTSPSKHFTFNKLYLQRTSPSTNFTFNTLHHQHTSPSTHFTIKTLHHAVKDPMNFRYCRWIFLFINAV
jgi:hypothetical protein